MSCRCDKDILLLLLKADRQAHPWIFFTVQSHELITVKILEFTRHVLTLWSLMGGTQAWEFCTPFSKYFASNHKIFAKSFHIRQVFLNNFANMGLPPKTYSFIPRFQQCSVLWAPKTCTVGSASSLIVVKACRKHTVSLHILTDNA
jgi:hypothetical protein